ncbi:fam-a protein [Plasmodium vinckei]|uniref:Fam-a protein n=1 Tax=Plasmodium vinckei TaxID=5860 RepID=A0A6V7TBC1_PLAVN|nr:fam-a protein [Plasmodium vinckei]
MNIGYIKIVLTLLSVAGFMQNIAFASESESITNSSNEENMDDFPISPKEAKQAVNVMAEALYLAREYAKLTKDYKLHSKKYGATLHFKKVNDTDVGRLEFKIHNSDNYADIVNTLWDINSAKNFDDEFIGGTLSRIYDQNLVIVQQRYKSHLKSWQRYYHALANKVESSEDETVILLVSSDMNDHYGDPIHKYVNPIVESANSFKPDINSQEDIREGNIFKMFVNLVAFFIKKETGCVKVTYISSIDLNFHPRSPYDFVKKVKAKNILKFINLKDIFKK